MAADRSSAIDVKIRLGSVTGPLPADEPRLIRFDAAGAYLAWPNTGRFRVDKECQVIVDPLTQDAQIVRFALLGPVMAAVLQLRGTPLLHGSAVAVGDEAIALVGRKRAGKSTTAAALVAAGCDMLNDDVLPLAHGRSPVMLTPGFPALKLEPSVWRALLPDLPIIGSPPTGTQDKILVSDGSSCSRSLPLRAVVVLDPDSSAKPLRLSPAEALQALLEHGYALKFANGALANGQAQLLFEACARLAREIPVIRAGRSNDITQLPGFGRRLLRICAENRRASRFDLPDFQIALS
jgi:hypothetical protein